MNKHSTFSMIFRDHVTLSFNLHEFSISGDESLPFFYWVFSCRRLLCDILRTIQYPDGIELNAVRGCESRPDYVISLVARYRRPQKRIGTVGVHSQ
jgi:hypothetical protein